MSNMALRFVTIVLMSIAMTACGKGGEKNSQSSTGVYGKEDAECFAGIVRAVEAKHMTPADFRNWKDKRVEGKDKDWLSSFSVSYAGAANVVATNLGKTPEELYKSKLITTQQMEIIEGYMSVYQEQDASKANAVSTSACAHIGFTKGLDLN